MASYPDVDSYLLAIDWTQNNWETFDFTGIDWTTLKASTVHALARAHRETNSGSFSPAHIEQLRRLNLQSSPIADPDANTPSKPIADFFIDSNAQDDTNILLAESPPPPSRFQGAEITEPTWLLGIGLDLAVAACGVPKWDPVGAAWIQYPDPHPTDGRWLYNGNNSLERYSDEFAAEIQTSIVKLLNDNAGVRCVPRDRDEASPRNLAHIKASLIEEYGEDPAEPNEGSPVRGRIPKLEDDEAVNQFNRHTADRDFRSASETWQLLANSVEQCRNDLAASRRWGNRQLNNIIQRFHVLIRTAWFQAKRDDLHVFVPGSKPRHRAWSVARWKLKREQGQQPVPVIIPWKNVKRDNYSPRPMGADRADLAFPEESYKWFYAKVASPIMPIGSGERLDAVFGKLSGVCKALRNGCRVHREMPSLESATIISIGNTHGFTLLNIKRIVTLWVLVERSMAKLHRRYRWPSFGGANLQTSVQLVPWSRLGFAAEALDTPGGSAVLYKRFIPKLSKSAYEYMENQMFMMVPAEWFFRLNRADQIFLRALWSYTTVSSLVEAIAPRSSIMNTSLRVRCEGDTRTGVPDNEPQTIEFRYMQGSLDPKHIMYWAIVCNGLVSFACTASRADYSDLFVDPSNLLEKFKVPQQAIDFFTAGIERGKMRGNGGWWDPEFPDVDWRDPFWPQSY